MSDQGRLRAARWPIAANAATGMAKWPCGTISPSSTFGEGNHQDAIVRLRECVDAADVLPASETFLDLSP
jgi:hypothetical protein